MRVLREGMSGSDVKEFQDRLAKAGFSPGAMDGEFGPGTTAAVLAFQNSEGLRADGIAGPATLAALGISDPQAASSGSSAPMSGSLPLITVQIAARMFPGAHLANISTNLPIVLRELQNQGLTSEPIVLAALATIRAETAGFVPISEGKSRFNTSPNGHPFDLYDNRKDLGNRGAPDGERYKGRGFVQLTGRANYAHFGQVIGEPLETNPDLANDPDVAAKLLAAFIKSKEQRIEQALLARNFLDARKAVNGGSHGLENFKDAYLTGERLLGAAVA